MRNIDVRTQCLGGPLARELGSGIIRDCSVTGAVTGHYVVGGLVGDAFGEIISCTATVGVRGRATVGGLVGSAQGVIADCSSSGSVRGDAQVGGLIGFNHFSLRGGIMTANSKPDVSQLNERVVQCRSDCTVTGDRYVGGLIGIAGRAGPVQDCHALGSVGGMTRVGGLIGVAGNCCVIRCFSSGRVSGREYAGGLIGESDLGADAELAKYPPGQFMIEEVKEPSSSGGEPAWRVVYRPAILSCFWDAEASGMARGIGGGTDAQGGIVRLTTAEMRTAARFQDFGWDFDSVWMIAPDTAYPKLRWEQASSKP